MLLSIQSAVFVAIAQVGTIVVGVLASGYYKSWITGDMRQVSPLATTLIYHYGIFAFAIPLIWIASAMRIRQQQNISEDTKSLMLISGIILLILLVIFFGYGLLKPLTYTDFTIGDGDDI